MIVLSFNCSGFASASRKITLKTLLFFYYPDITMLQESLRSGEEIKLALNKMLPRWTFLTLDSKGRSGGMALGVKYCSMKLLNSWGSNLTLGVEVYAHELCSELTLQIFMDHVNTGFLS